MTLLSALYILDGDYNENGIRCSSFSSRAYIAHRTPAFSDGVVAIALKQLSGISR